MSSSSSKLFQKATHVALYSKYRPTYPKSLVKLLLGYLLQNGGSQDLALDVGCGSGQSTFQLQGYFKQCLGIDISGAQIKEAQEKAKLMEVEENVKFLVRDAANLSVESGTVDLITAATAWHWIPDKNNFHTECKRALKSKGCLALYAYGLVRLPAPHYLTNELIYCFCFNTLKDYWHEAINDVFKEYREVVLPFHNVERHDLVMSQKASLADLIGFISSWSAYRKLCESHPGNLALQELEQNIMTEITGGKSTCNPYEVQIDMEFPLFTILGQNNK